MTERNKKKQEERNIYIPVEGRIEDIVRQTDDVSLFSIRSLLPMDYTPGQFFMVSVWGYGEVPISVSSICRDAYITEFCIRNAGYVTNAIHSLGIGDPLWFRGPYGNGFEIEQAGSRDIIIIAGGIGLAPLRPLMQHFTDSPDDYGTLNLICGSKTPDDIIFKNDLDNWKKRSVNVIMTVDTKDNEWKGNVGLVTEFCNLIEADCNKTEAFICGPEMMIVSAIDVLSGMGIPDDRIITTLEAHMKCGVGKCGHCYNGRKYTCTDGPVFSFKEMKAMEAGLYS